MEIDVKAAEAQNDDVRADAAARNDRHDDIAQATNAMRDRLSLEWLTMKAPHPFKQGPDDPDDGSEIGRKERRALHVARVMRALGLSKQDAKFNVNASWGVIHALDYDLVVEAINAAYDEETPPELHLVENLKGIPFQRIVTLKDVIEECIYISDGQQVAYIDRPHEAMTLAEFKTHTAGSKIENGGKSIKVADAWITSPSRLDVVTRTFAPGQPIVCVSPKGVSALNLWKGPNRVPPLRAADYVAAFLAHIEYLVPYPAERERFLDWLAHIEQRPGELPMTHYLFIATETGIGRNWLTEALGKVFGRYVAENYDLAEYMRTNFTGDLAGKVLACVDELKEGGPNQQRGGANMGERLKSMLTAQFRHVNPKYGRQYVEFNACRFLMLSNYLSALPLADNDRRVIVIENPNQPRPADYYTRIYKMLDDPGFGDAIGLWFAMRDISKFNAGDRAPMNDAKARAIRAGRTEREQAVRDIAADWPCDLIRADRMLFELENTTGEKLKSAQGFVVEAGLEKLDKKRPIIDGKKRQIWIIRNREKWREASAEEIRAEVMKAETARPPVRSTGDIFQ
jgi:hypothetical protein